MSFKRGGKQAKANTIEKAKIRSFCNFKGVHNPHKKNSLNQIYERYPALGKDLPANKNRNLQNKDTTTYNLWDSL